MWLWIVSAIFLIFVWLTWFFINPVADTPGAEPPPEIFPFWVALTITVVVVGALVGLVIYRRIRARRAARALEKAIAQQAQEQVLQAKPENRAEVQALQKQMLDGIKAIKKSRLGGDSGNALYSLPWYAIVGPPGAGKTTALRHSGLNFPYLDPNGGGVKGIGGTRNCDWWFTNEAILLDTAGRYTTEADDHEEWMAFLDMLLNYRSHKPLNGVIIAVSISDLIDASEDEIEQTADRIRDRIDEMQEQLRMILPVYVMFTKCDLIAGFVEYFGSFKRSERGQAWGATFPLSLDKASPGPLFDDEFDILVEKLHSKAVNRMNDTRASRRDKEKIYQFPLEFAAVKQNLSDFMAACFRPAAKPANKKAPNIPTPILRGFYFTSGTQEGRPLDRVVGAMGRAFGLRVAEDDEADAAQADSKSYFLKEVFTGIIFPDQDIAGRTEDEIKRLRWQRMALAVGACAVALLFAGPAINSFMKNRELVAKTKLVTDQAAQIDWNDPRPATAKLDQLDPLLEHLMQLRDWKENGAPISYRWGMYQGDKLYEAALAEYVYILRYGFLLRVKERLEKKLQTTTGAKYLEEYYNLKTYLLLSDVPHLNLDQNLIWETGRLKGEWAEILRPTTSLSDRDLRNKLSRHVTFYSEGLARTSIKGEELNLPLIQRTRDILTRVGPSQRYYDQFVTYLEFEKIDQAGPDTSDNLKHPPITLNTLFADRPDVLAKLTSKRKRREGKWKKVRGPYTKAGHKAVVAGLKEGYERLDREKWVVPLTTEEKQQADKINQALARVRQDYDNQYITEWTEFFRDIDVAVPTNNIEAIAEFKVLSTPDWPYWRLLRALKNHTQFAAKKSAAEEEATKKGGVVDQVKRKVQRRLDTKLRTPGASKALQALGLGGGSQYRDPVPDKFKKMVEFGFPPGGKEGEPGPPSKLSEYVGQLEKLAGEMTLIEEGPPSAETAKATELFEGAVSDTEKKLLKMDRTGQLLMRELLMNPLKQSYKAMVKSAGGAASGLWEVEVWPGYRDNIKNRYPFNTAAKRDASFEDAVAFYNPKGGTLWGFYDNYLKGFHRRQNHKFFPTTRLGGSPRPAKRFTPFNPNLYNCLERSHEISDALFSQGEPGVKFRVNLTTVSPIVSEIEFSLDGKKRLYRNEKEFWHDFKWPGEEGPPGASIRIRGAGGLDEEIRRDGPWGMWRLLEAGRHGAKKDSDRVFEVEWQFTAPPVTVKMQVRPTRGNHPFSPNFFRDTNCPPSIGDRFGG